jgi:hypothetical protein
MFWALVTPICNSSYLGGRDRKDHSSRLAQANISWDPHLQNNQSKMNWRCGSSGGAPSLQVQSPEFKPQSHVKKEKKKKKRDSEVQCPCAQLHTHFIWASVVVDGAPSNF